MSYILQEGTPPKPIRVAPRPRKYPFQELNVRQFFFSPGIKPHTMMSLASATGKRLGRRFVTRQLYMRMEKGLWVQCAPGDKDAKLGVAVYREA